MKFISTVLFLAVLQATSFAQKPWKFIVTCDSRGSTNGINPIILSELASEIVGQGVDFVLFPGDLVSGYSATGPSEFEAHLRTWVEVTKPVYDSDIAVFLTMRLVMFGAFILVPTSTRMTILPPAGSTSSAATLTLSKSCPITALPARNI